MRQQLDQFHAGKTPSRQARLKAWLAYHGIGYKDLAESIGVHPSMITRLCSGERRTPERIRQLVELGIPPELLPEPGENPPGRPKKKPGT